LYYGEWVPNTALIKITFSFTHLKAGTVYILWGFISSMPLSAVSLPIMVFLLKNKGTRGRAILLLLSGLLWMICIAAVGGDIFHGWRRHIPLILMTALLLSEFVVYIVQRVASKKLLTAFILSIFLLLGWTTHRQYYDWENLLLRTGQWVWDGKVVGQMLKKGFGDVRPTVAVTSAGCIPYWSELPCIDMLGLNDYYLPRNPSKYHGRGWIGHELGDVEYILNRSPDLILFGAHGIPKSVLPVYRPMLQMPRFKENYTPVIFAEPSPSNVRSRIWVHRHSPKVGLRDTGTEIVVPSYLLNANPSTVTTLNTEGEFIIHIDPNDSAGISDLSVPTGTWEIETHPPGKGFVLEIQRTLSQDNLQHDTSGSSYQKLAHAHPPVQITLSGKNPIPLEVWVTNPGSETMELHALNLVLLNE
jgi:hypothetical protein